MSGKDPSGSANNTIVSKLDVGTEYEVRVAAKTELGEGPSSYGTVIVTTFNSEFSLSLSVSVIERSMCDL